VAVAEAQGLLDHAGADAALQFPGAEAEQRDPRAVGFNGRYVCTICDHIGILSREQQMSSWLAAEHRKSGGRRPLDHS
jgi:hypothetical protein